MSSFKLSLKIGQKIFDTLKFTDFFLCGQTWPVCLILTGGDFNSGEGENESPFIEDKPLARSLYKVVEVDAEIPIEFYVPIAKLVRVLSENQKRPF